MFIVSEVIFDSTCSPKSGHEFGPYSPELADFEDLELRIIKVQNCNEVSPSLMRTRNGNRCVKEAGSYCGHRDKSWGVGVGGWNSCPRSCRAGVYEGHMFEPVLDKLPITL